MATFSNQATLTYNGNSTNSNIAYGELLDALNVTKTAVEGGYTPGERVTYAVTLQNTGSTALTGITVSDNLGGYAFGANTLYPLTYEAGTATLFVNGAPQPAPTVTAGPPVTFTGITIPAGGSAVLVYQTRANEFANPAAGGTVNNTATVTGAGLTAPLTATAALPANEAPALAISKAISPAQVTNNEPVTYTLVIQNSGSTPVQAAENAVITDTLNPVLTNLTVAFNGTPLTAGTQYTYNEATGQFATAAGQITVPAATVTQDTATGAYTVTPGTSTLTITGTI